MPYRAMNLVYGKNRKSVPTATSTTRADAHVLTCGPNDSAGPVEAERAAMSAASSAPGASIVGMATSGAKVPRGARVATEPGEAEAAAARRLTPSTESKGVTGESETGASGAACARSTSPGSGTSDGDGAGASEGALTRAAPSLREIRA